MKINNYQKTGIIVTLALALLIWGISYLKGDNLLTREALYYAVFEKVDGLTISSSVIIKGLKVGTVREIFFKEGNTDKVVVLIGIKRKYKLPKNTQAYLFSSDIMGTKAIQLIYGDDKNNYVQIGDTLSSKIEKDLMEQVNIQVVPLKNKAEKLMLSFDSVLIAIRAIFNEKTQENLSKSFSSIRTTLKNLETTTFTLDNIVQKEKGDIARIIANLDSITRSLVKNMNDLDRTFQNLASVSDSLKQSKIIENIGHTVSNLNLMLAQINEGKGTIGMLMKNDTLYTNLQNTSYNLNRLVRDLRENPKRYINVSLIDVGRTVYVSDEKQKRKEEKQKEKEQKKK